jgi:hypothetical protein
VVAGAEQAVGLDEVKLLVGKALTVIVVEAVAVGQIMLDEFGV